MNSLSSGSSWYKRFSLKRIMARCHTAMASASHHRGRQHRTMARPWVALCPRWDTGKDGLKLKFVFEGVFLPFLVVCPRSLVLGLLILPYDWPPSRNLSVPPCTISESSQLFLDLGCSIRPHALFGGDRAGRGAVSKQLGAGRAVEK